MEKYRAKGKKAVNQEEAWRVEEDYKEKPHGWIQWKGTDVCMDLYCKCGEAFHVDADFCYAVQCPTCKTAYSCSGYIELIELEEQPNNVIVGFADNDE